MINLDKYENSKYKIKYLKYKNKYLIEKNEFVEDSKLNIKNKSNDNNEFNIPINHNLQMFKNLNKKTENDEFASNIMNRVYSSKTNKIIKSLSNSNENKIKSKKSSKKTSKKTSKKSSKKSSKKNN